jgi:carboxyl-terminal processing protease
MKSILSYRILLILFGTLLNNNALGQREYLEEAIKIIENNSIRRDSVDFQRIKYDAYAKLENAHSIRECYPIITFILDQLRDNHSFLMEKQFVDRWASTSKTDNTQSVSFSGRVINNDVGYIKVKDFSSGDSTAMSEFSNNLQNLIKTLDGQHIRGWIVDIRENTGGNCWPMLTGLGPLIGDGICGYFINANQKKSAWYYKDGVAGVNSVGICKVSNPAYKLKNQNQPIAVLTGPHTASSGEIVAIAFRGKNNTKSFGQSTAGLSTGNGNFRLSDGSMIFLTSSIDADRRENAYGGRVKPDYYIPFEYYEINTDRDKLPSSAIEWIYQNK